MELLGPKHVETIAVGANPLTVLSADLPRDRFIQAVIVRMELIGDTAASGTTDENLIAAIITQMRITANGSDQRVAASGHELWEYGKFRSQVSLSNTLLTTVSQTDTSLGILEFCVNFQVSQDPRKNMQDPSALLPAHMMSNLTISFQMAGAAALGTLYTVDSGTIRISVIEASLDEEETDALIQPGNFFAYYLTSTTQPIVAAAASYEFEMPIPVGKIIRRLMLTSVRAGVRINGDSDPGDVTGFYAYRVRDKRRGDLDLIDCQWEESQTHDIIAWGIASDTGITMADLAGIGSFDTRGYSQGQAVLQGSTAINSGVSQIQMLTEAIVPAQAA